MWDWHTRRAIMEIRYLGKVNMLKTKLRGMSKKIIVGLAVVMMGIGCFAPMTKVFAEPNVDPVGGEENIDFDIAVTNTSVVAWINNKVVVDDSEGPQSSFVGTIEQAGTTDASETNVLRLQTSFGEPLITEYTINNTTYTESSTGVEVQDDNWTITVPGAAKYTIRGTGDDSVAVPRTIIWTNPNYVPESAEDEEWIQEFKLENGAGYIREIRDLEGNVRDLSEYIGEDNVDRGVNEKGFGWVTVTPGDTVEFEFVPEYGYQLTSIQINGQNIGAATEVNRFSFVMPDTNIHFDAEFTKTDDVVKSNTAKVDSGTINLARGSFESGTAKLEISDATSDITDEQKAKFAENAGDYAISTYLDIDLYNTFYKGTTDETQAWDEQKLELERLATITLKLADGVDGNSVVIIHELHDARGVLTGEYEIIPTTYDPETNTITFRTKSFSNFAIASRTMTEGAAAPDTGYLTTAREDDSAELTYSGIAIVAATVAVLGIARILRKRAMEE